MATNKNTWDGAQLEILAESRCTKPENFMKNLFLNLGHESCVSRKKMKESLNFCPKIQKELAAFKKAKDKLVGILIEATENSDYS